MGGATGPNSHSHPFARGSFRHDNQVNNSILGHDTPGMRHSNGLAMGNLNAGISLKVIDDKVCQTKARDDYVDMELKHKIKMEKE